MRFDTFLGAFSGLLAFASMAVAAYTDPSILTIEGVQRTVSDQYPVQRLRSDFKNVEIETRTPWTKEGETIKFRGPRIADVLRRHGLDVDKSVQFVAYDNFTSEILLEEIQSYQPIFAIDRACAGADVQSGRCKADQEFTPLSPEEQGPIFLVWPYQQLPAEYVPARNSIWVWFVVAIRPVE
jgi:hypothetical protein